MISAPTSPWTILCTRQVEARQEHRRFTARSRDQRPRLRTRTATTCGCVIKYPRGPSNLLVLRHSSGSRRLCVLHGMTVAAGLHGSQLTDQGCH